MKQKVVKKLSLSKSTVVNLENVDMNSIRGKGNSDSNDPQDGSCISCAWIICNSYISCNVCPC